MAATLSKRLTWMALVVGAALATSTSGVAKDKDQKDEAGPRPRVILISLDGARAMGDSSANPYSVPNFYGAHGHDSSLPSMSAIFFAAGPDVKQGNKPLRVRNIDVAPTILDILGVAPAATVDGSALTAIMKH